MEGKGTARYMASPLYSQYAPYTSHIYTGKAALTRWRRHYIPHLLPISPLAIHGDGQGSAHDMASSLYSLSTPYIPPSCIYGRWARQRSPDGVVTILPTYSLYPPELYMGDGQGSAHQMASSVAVSQACNAISTSMPLAVAAAAGASAAGMGGSAARRPTAPWALARARPCPCPAGMAAA